MPKIAWVSQDFFFRLSTTVPYLRDICSKTPLHGRKGRKKNLFDICFPFLLDRHPIERPMRDLQEKWHTRTDIANQYSISDEPASRRYGTMSMRSPIYTLRTYTSYRAVWSVRPTHTKSSSVVTTSAHVPDLEDPLKKKDPRGHNTYFPAVLYVYCAGDTVIPR